MGSRGRSWLLWSAPKWVPTMFSKRSFHSCCATVPRSISDPITAPSSQRRRCRTGFDVWGSSPSAVTRDRPLRDIAMRCRVGQCMGERRQGTLQWNTAPGGSQWGMGDNNRAGPDRYQSLAQAIQSCSTASGSQHAPTRSRNTMRETPDQWPKHKGVRQSEKQPLPTFGFAVAKPATQNALQSSEAAGV